MNTLGPAAGKELTSGTGSTASPSPKTGPRHIKTSPSGIVVLEPPTGNLLSHRPHLFFFQFFFYLCTKNWRRPCFVNNRYISSVGRHIPNPGFIIKLQQ